MKSNWKFALVVLVGSALLMMTYQNCGQFRSKSLSGAKSQSTGLSPTVGILDPAFLLDDSVSSQVFCMGDHVVFPNEKPIALLCSDFEFVSDLLKPQFPSYSFFKNGLETGDIVIENSRLVVLKLRGVELAKTILAQVPDSLKELHLDYISVSELKLSGGEALEKLSLKGNKLTSLDGLTLSNPVALDISNNPFSGKELLEAGSKRQQFLGIKFDGLKDYSHVSLKENEEMIGDMIIRHSGVKKGGVGIKSVTTPDIRLWPGGRMPVEFGEDVTEYQKVEFFRACDEWSAAGNIQCVLRSGEEDYMGIINQPTCTGACYSTVGAMSGGVMGLGSCGCYDGSVIKHELGHAFGLWHEQMRSDRDEYVTFVEANTDPQYAGNFYKFPNSNNAGPYDFLSILHYPFWAFSTRPYDPADPTAHLTLLPKPGYTQFIDYSDGLGPIGHRTVLSSGDVAGIRALYGPPVPQENPRVNSFSAETQSSGYNRCNIKVTSASVSNLRPGYWLGVLDSYQRLLKCLAPSSFNDPDFSGGIYSGVQTLHARLFTTNDCSGPSLPSGGTTRDVVCVPEPSAPPELYAIVGSTEVLPDDNCRVSALVLGRNIGNSHPSNPGGGSSVYAHGRHFTIESPNGGDVSLPEILSPGQTVRLEARLTAYNSFNPGNPVLEFKTAEVRCPAVGNDTCAIMEFSPVVNVHSEFSSVHCTPLSLWNGDVADPAVINPIAGFQPEGIGKVFCEYKSRGCGKGTCQCFRNVVVPRESDGTCPNHIGMPETPAPPAPGTENCD